MKLSNGHGATEKSVLFSIIVPVHDCEEFLPYCLNSLSKQTCDDFEVILVDDGSTDSSYLICQSYGEKDARFKVVKQNNAGPLIARKTGFVHSKGKYILHVDADDALRQDTLETIESYITNKTYDVILIEMASSPSFSSVVKKFPFPNSRSFDESEAFILMNLIFSHTCCLNSMCTKVVRREVLAAANASLHTNNSKMVVSEDYLQSLAILDTAKRYYYLDEPLYFYRSNTNGTTDHWRQSDLWDYIQVYNYLTQKILRWQEIPGFVFRPIDVKTYFLNQCYLYLRSAIQSGAKGDYEIAFRTLLSNELAQERLHSLEGLGNVRADKKIAIICASKRRRLMTKIAIEFSLLASKAKMHICNCSFCNINTKD